METDREYRVNPRELWSLDTEFGNQEEELINLFWEPNPLLTERLKKYLKDNQITENIIDVGCGTGTNIFPAAKYIIGKSLTAEFPHLSFIDLDLDFDIFPQQDNFFNFIYCRHTMEDIQNPQHMFKELTRIGKRGYIETPSPMVELSKFVQKSSFRGYSHHRYIIWSDLETNTLHCLPKFPILEYLIFNKEKLFNHILNNYPVFWNNYYFWDETHPPKIIVYRNEINFDINTEYIDLLLTGVSKSINYSRYFLKNII